MALWVALLTNCYAIAAIVYLMKINRLSERNPVVVPGVIMYFMYRLLWILVWMYACEWWSQLVDTVYRSF